MESLQVNRDNVYHYKRCLRSLGESEAGKIWVLKLVPKVEKVGEEGSEEFQDREHRKCKGAMTRCKAFIRWK